jgi:hypothetical protein
MENPGEATTFQPPRWFESLYAADKKSRECAPNIPAPSNESDQPASDPHSENNPHLIPLSHNAMLEFMHIRSLSKPLPTVAPTLIMGVTACGKSTTLSLLIGEDMAFGYPPDYSGKRLVSKQKLFLHSSKDPLHPEHMAFPIGTGIISTTTTPRIFPQDEAERQRYGYDGPLLVDCPGFFDTRSELIDFYNTVLLDPLINHPSGIHVITMISATFKDDSNSTTSALSLLADKVGCTSAKDFVNCISLIVTKTDPKWGEDAFDNFIDTLSNAKNWLAALASLENDRVGFVFKAELDNKDAKEPGFTIQTQDKIFLNVKEAIRNAPIIPPRPQAQAIPNANDPSTPPQLSFSTKTQAWISDHVRAFATDLIENWLTPRLTTLFNDIYSMVDQEESLINKFKCHVTLHDESGPTQQLLSLINPCPTHIDYQFFDQVRELYGQVGQSFGFSHSEEEALFHYNIAIDSGWEYYSQLFRTGYYFLAQCDNIYKSSVIRETPPILAPNCPQLASKFDLCLQHILKYIVAQFEHTITIDNAKKLIQLADPAPSPLGALNPVQPFALTAKFVAGASAKGAPNLSLEDIVAALHADNDISTMNPNFHKTLHQLKGLVSAPSLKAHDSTIDTHLSRVVISIRTHWDQHYQAKIPTAFALRQPHLQNFVQTNLFEPLLAALETSTKPASSSALSPLMLHNNLIMRIAETSKMIEAPTWEQLVNHVYPLVSELHLVATPKTGGCASKDEWEHQLAEFKAAYLLANADKSINALQSAKVYQITNYQQHGTDTSHNITSIYNALVQSLGNDLTHQFRHAICQPIAKEYLQVDFPAVNTNNTPAFNHEIVVHRLLPFQTRTPPCIPLQSLRANLTTFPALAAALKDLELTWGDLYPPTLQQSIKGFIKQISTDLPTQLQTALATASVSHCLQDIITSATTLHNTLQNAFSAAKPSYAAAFLADLGANLLNYTKKHFSNSTITYHDPSTLRTLVESSNQVFASCALLKVGKSFDLAQMKKAAGSSDLCIFNNLAFKREWEDPRNELALKGCVITIDVASATISELSKFVNSVQDGYAQVVDECISAIIPQYAAQISQPKSKHRAVLHQIKALNGAVSSYSQNLRELFLQLTNNDADTSTSRQLADMGEIYDLTRPHQSSPLRVQFPRTDRVLADLDYNVHQIALAEKEVVQASEFIMTRQCLKMSDFVNDIKSNSRTNIADTFVAVGFDEIIWDHDVSLPGKNLYVVAPKITLIQAKVNVNLSALAPTGASTYRGAPGVHGLDSGNFKFATTSLERNRSSIALSSSNVDTYFSLSLNGSNGSNGQQGQDGRDGKPTNAVPQGGEFWDKYNDSNALKWSVNYKSTSEYTCEFVDTSSFLGTTYGNLTITSNYGGVNPTYGGPGGVGGTGGSAGTAHICIADVSQTRSGKSGGNGATGSDGARGSTAYKSRMRKHLQGAFSITWESPEWPQGPELDYYSHPDSRQSPSSRQTLKIPSRIPVAFPDVPSLLKNFQAIPMVQKSLSSGRVVIFP